MNLEKIYKQTCVQNGWIPDPAHVTVLETLNQVIKSRGSRGLFNFFRPRSPAHSGCYIYGDVGRGKTFLMDLFYEGCSIEKKNRWHFTEFMQMVHGLLKENAQIDGQPLELAALSLSKSYQLICLDEFQVTEIADAMILSRLFEKLFDHGCQIITTSNLHPNQLYRDGLHYDRFKPFVDLLLDQVYIIHLESHNQADYRRLGHRHRRHKFKTEDLKHLEVVFSQNLKDEGLKPAEFIINERKLVFPQATKTTLWLDFTEACETALGPAEYQAIAQRFKTIYLVNVPLMSEDHRDATRRFITLIDCLYDQGVKLFLHAEAEPDALYQDQGKKNALPFARTASRLVQMSVGD